MTDPHSRFQSWLTSGAAGEPPRDAAVHASMCDSCAAAISAFDRLERIDPGKASGLPDSNPSPVAAVLRFGRIAVISVVVMAAAAGLGYGAIKVLAGLPWPSGVAQASPTPTATETAQPSTNTPGPTPSPGETPTALPPTPVSEEPFGTPQLITQTVPGAPVLTAKAGINKVNLSWTKPNTGGFLILHYNVYRDGSSTRYAIAGGTSYTDSAVGPGQTHKYYVVAVNILGAGPHSNTGTATTPNVPGAPVLTATAGAGQINLSWTVPASNGSAIVRYDIFKDAAATAFATATTPSYIDVVGNGVTHTYVVKAVNAVGSSAASNSAGATTTGPTVSGALSVITPGSTSVSTDIGSTSITVQVKLSDGTNKTTGGDTVQLSTTNGALLPVTDNGNGTYSASLSDTVAESAVVSGTVNAMTIGTNASVTFTPGVATQLVVSAPSSAAAGVAFNFTVTARDQHGNLATGYSGTIHFTSTDSSAVLPPDRGLTGGSDTFSATLNAVGNSTITADDGPLSGTSGQIAVS